MSSFDQLVNYIIFVVVHAELNDSIEILARQIILVHPLNDFLDSGL